MSAFSGKVDFKEIMQFVCCIVKGKRERLFCFLGGFFSIFFILIPLMFGDLLKYSST